MNSRKQWSEWRHKNEIKNLSLHYRLIYHRGPLAIKVYFVIIYNRNMMAISKFSQPITTPSTMMCRSNEVDEFYYNCFIASISNSPHHD